MKSQIRFISLGTATLIFLSSFSSAALWAQLPAKLDSNTRSSDWPVAKRSKHLTIRLNPGADASLYSTISIGTIAYTGPADRVKTHDSEELEFLLHDSLANDLTRMKRVANPALARKLTANISITNVKRTHPWINILTTVAVFVPLDFGQADVTAEIVDQQTGEVVAEIDSEGCGQIYEVIPSFQPLGQTRLALKKAGHSIARELTRMNWNGQPSDLAENGGN